MFPAQRGKSAEKKSTRQGTSGLEYKPKGFKNPGKENVILWANFPPIFESYTFADTKRKINE